MTLINITRLILTLGMTTLLATGVLQAATREIPLQTGTLSIPETDALNPLSIDLIIHLHGAKEVVKRNLAGHHSHSVLISITLPGLSSVYRRHFEKADVFPALLEEARQTMVKELQTPRIQYRHLTLMSFSAGFGGVRELLKQPDSVEQIDAIVMADSIYAGFIGDLEERQVNDSHMEPFLAFARQAVTGGKQLIISHTQLHTPDYASTKETAAWLMQRLKGQHLHKHVTHPNGMLELSRFRNGHFHIIEFEGDTGEDHMNHLRHIGMFLDMVVTDQ